MSIRLVEIHPATQAGGATEPLAHSRALADALPCRDFIISDERGQRHELISAF
jgi:hypothetical protein